MNSLLPWCALLLPLVAAIAITLFTLRFKALSSFLSVAAVLGSFGCSCLIFGSSSISAPAFTWIDISGVFQVPLGLVLDNLSKTMLVLVSGVGSLIHIYSLGYMRDDEGKSRYFAALSLFMSLDAYFIGIIQVLVYAGAVMVLFLFIIMLLDLRAEERRRVNWLTLSGGIAVAFALLIQIFYVIGHLRSAGQTFPSLARSRFDDVRSVGLLLFENYNLPFQIIGVLVLVATIGVVLLSKREPR